MSDQREIPVHTGAIPIGAGVLTRKEIEERGLIINPVDGRMQATSYDLSLGCEYRGEEDRGKHCTLSSNEQLIIPQYGVVLVCSKEIVKTDNITAGRFDLKIRHALSGLVLQVGTQVEPNYKGQLFGLILNLSDKPVKIYEGAPIFTIEFHTLISPVEGNERTVSGLGEFLRSKNIEDPVRSSLNRIKTDLTGDLSNILKQHVEQLHAKWESQVETQLTRHQREMEENLARQQQEIRDKLSQVEQSRVSRMAVGLSTLAGVLFLFLSIFLPIYLNKTTYDVDDTLLQQLRSYKAQEMLRDDQSSQALIKYLHEHPDELKKLLEEVQSGQSIFPLTPGNQTDIQKPKSNIVVK